jgi:hypothetical protein
MPKNKKLDFNSGIQTYQILTNDDEVCIPSRSSILLAVRNIWMVPCHKSNMIFGTISTEQNAWN